MTHPIDIVADIVGSLSEVGRRLNVRRATVSYWKKPGVFVPPKYCPQLERMVNHAVLCEQLNPTIDWGVVLERPKRRRKPA